MNAQTFSSIAVPFSSVLGLGSLHFSLKLTRRRVQGSTGVSLWEYSSFSGSQLGSGPVVQNSPRADCFASVSEEVPHDSLPALLWSCKETRRMRQGMELPCTDPGNLLVLPVTNLQRLRGEKYSFGSYSSSRFLAVPLICCMTLGRSLPFSMPRFPHLWTWQNACSLTLRGVVEIN